MSLLNNTLGPRAKEAYHKTTMIAVHEWLGVGTRKVEYMDDTDSERSQEEEDKKDQEG